MSNRQRLDRMRDEAEIRERERGKAKEPARFKFVWAIRDGSGEVVGVFPYARKPAAEAEAKRRGLSLAKLKVPFDG